MLKKTVSILLAVVLSLCIISVVPVIVEAETCGDFSYILSNGNALINNYYGDATELDIPAELDGYAVTEIYNLSNKNNLQSVNIPDSVTIIRNYAFQDCTNLTGVSLGNSVSSIGSYAFRNCKKLKSILIPNSVNDLGTGVFWDCSELESVELPDALGSINSFIFYECANLKSVNMPGSVTGIGACSFYGCSSLKSITFPNTLKGLSNQAFAGCASLKSIFIPSSVTGIYSGTVFAGCKSLESIVVDENNAYYDSRNNCNAIIETRTHKLMTGCKNTIIPDTVLIIDQSAFQGCEDLESITIPDSVVSIGWQSFDGCKKLNSLIIPDSVTTISCFAFQYCTGLLSVTIGSSVREIDQSAFCGCSILTNVTISSSQTKIIRSAFSGCKNITDIWFKGTEEDWSNINIESGNDYLQNATVHFCSFGPSTKIGIMFCDTDRIKGSDIAFSSEWFFNDSAVYNHSIAQLSSQMLLEGYISEDNDMNGVAEDLDSSLFSLGFKIDKNYIDLDTGRNDMNHFIVSQPITKGNESFNLVYVGCIGSWHEQWNSNFDPDGKESSAYYSDSASLRRINHIGFNDAKNFIYTRLVKYMNKYGYDKSNTKVLLTGHSRGAATANLLSAKLIDDPNNEVVSPENLFTYAFATPNCTCNNETSDARYSRIFNIVNPTDFVTKVMPAAWGYRRYGTTYTLPSVNNDKNYYSYYNKMKKYYDILNQATSDNTWYNVYPTGETAVYNVINKMTKYISGLDDYYYKRYSSGIVGTKTPFEFIQSGLCPYVNSVGNKDSAKKVMLEALGGSDLFRSISLFFISNGAITKSFGDAHKMETYCSFLLGLNESEVTTFRKGYKGTVNCPVDVEITDKGTGEVVGRIVNNTVDEEISAKDNSIVMSVDGDEKTFWLPSNGNYDVRIIGNDTGTMDYTLSEINPDSGEISRVNYNDLEVDCNKSYAFALSDDQEEDTGVSDILLKDSNGNEVIANEIVLSDESVKYTVETNVIGSGNATETVTVISGDYITLIASPKQSSFIGWYQGDTLISEDTEYRFKPTENTSLTAKFTYTIGDVDLDGKITISDVTEIQRHLAELIHFTDEKLVPAKISC